MSKRSAVISLVFISILHGLNHMYGIFLSPLNEEMRQFFGAESISAVTSFKATYLIIYAASNLFFGVLTNRMSARWTLGLGGLLNALAVMAYTFIRPSGIVNMHVLWAVGAIGAGTYHPVANVLITRLYPSRKGWALGITGMGAGAGFTFGPLATGFLSNTLGFDWQQISKVFGSFGLFCAIAVLLAVRDVPVEVSHMDERELPETETERPKQANGRALAFFIGFIIIAVGLREIAMWSIMDISDFYLSRAYEGRAETAWYLFLIYLPGIFIQPVAGIISDRVSRNWLATFALGLHAVSIALIAFTPHALLFMPFMLVGVGQAASVPVVEAFVADFTTPRNRGLVFGVLVTAGFGLGALGPLLSGLLVDSLGGTIAAYKTCFVLLGGLTAVAAVLMAFSGMVIKRLGLRQ